MYCFFILKKILNIIKACTREVKRWFFVSELSLGLKTKNYLKKNLLTL